MVIKVNENFFIKWETVTFFEEGEDGITSIHLISGERVVLGSEEAKNFWKEAMTATKYERLNAEIVAVNIEAIVNPHSIQGVKTGIKG